MFLCVEEATSSEGVTQQYACILQLGGGNMPSHMINVLYDKWAMGYAGEWAQEDLHIAR